MISILRGLGIEPQAIEQPLDLSIPENKLMLAIYLSTSEVENDRRALNVIRGMRKARKEGRWMASAPIGYKNITTEGGKKMIVPKEPQATLIKHAFEKIATGMFSTEQIWKVSKANGLKCCKNNFLVTMRNPVYYGKIFIPKYKDEESQLATGLHQPLISEKLYKEVQDVMDGRKQKQGIKIFSPDELPLRIRTARELLLKGDLDGADYKTVKIECEEQVGRLEIKLFDVSSPKINIENQLENAVNVLLNLDLLYKNGGIALKREIIGSIFPEKLSFDGEQHRTTRVNEAASIIYLISSNS